ncbi:hypothetical protein PHISCL_04978 [Aspergillus sclerotialis]|uniref:Uncharacterized protein n=1 Tax=Aspergillus sclerotialis TaxID=2070753 RepID=A0A3A2ZXE5_9EURO|nr:hypothetical protein PHISCL_04978 [Aspergillus sclerotialis]
MDPIQQAVPGTTPVPSTADDLETTAQKLEALANVVKEGNSLALYTGLKLSSPKPRDAESIALSQMTPSELESYTDWKTRTTPVPPFDWEHNKTPIPTGAQSEKKFTRRAEAMDVVWGYKGATPEHASWLTFNMPGTLPLVKAVSRVLTAQLHYQNDPLVHLGPMEVAEIETAKSIVRIAQGNRERELQRIRKATRSMTRSIEVLNSRMDSLEKSEPSAQKRSQSQTQVPVPDGSPPGGVRLGE